MPASRNARAITLAPRSWPSSPGFATRTRIGTGVEGKEDSGIGRRRIPQRDGIPAAAGQSSGVARIVSGETTSLRYGIEEGKRDGEVIQRYFVRGAVPVHRARTGRSAPLRDPGAGGGGGRHGLQPAA